MFVSAWLVVGCLVTVAMGAVKRSDFVPYGSSAGDLKLKRNDDESSPKFNLNATFKYFGHNHHALWVNTNGGVSFVDKISQYDPKCDAVPQKFRMISPFWADVDTRKHLPGKVYYREAKSNERRVYDQATRDARAAFPDLQIGQMTWAFVATWHKVTFFHGSNSKPPYAENTFQLLLSTDNKYSFAIFYYDKISWTTGDASQKGPNARQEGSGLGGLAARAGFDAGDGVHLYKVRGSCSDDIIKLPSLSNCNSPGKFVFRIDGKEIQHPTTVAPTTPPPPTPLSYTASTCKRRGYCKCDAGYTGENCETRIAVCNTPLPGFIYDAPRSAVCGHNDGTCEGKGSFKCKCQAGFSGTFCEKFDSKSFMNTERCLVYAARGDSSTPNVTLPIGCDHRKQHEKCIPDDLNCMLDRDCPYPLGWCIPRVKHSKKFARRLSTLGGFGGV